MTFPCLVSRLNLEQQLFYRVLHKKKENLCAGYRKVSFLDATLPVCPSLKLMYLSSLTSSHIGFLTFRHLSPSLIGNLDPVDNRGSAGEGAPSAIFF